MYNFVNAGTKYQSFANNSDAHVGHVNGEFYAITY